MTADGWEVVLDADAQDQDLPSLAPWVQVRKRQRLPPGAVQTPGNGASPLALAAAQGGTLPPGGQRW
jgi:hypothetical protein